MSKASLTLPPLTGIQDRNVQSALQAIGNWARAINDDYVSKDELKLSSQQTQTAITSAASSKASGLTLSTLRDYLQSSSTSIVIGSENMLQTDQAANRGVKIGTAGIVGYDTSGNPTIAIDARTGDAYFYGTVMGAQIVGTTNIDSAGYIYATGVNLAKAITFKPGLTAYGSIVGEAATGYAAGVVGIVSGANSVGAVGWASGASSIGGSFIGTSIGLYCGGTGSGSGLALQADGPALVSGALTVGMGATITGGMTVHGGRIYWHNLDDGNTYDVLTFAYTGYALGFENQSNIASINARLAAHGI